VKDTDEEIDSDLLDEAQRQLSARTSHATPARRARPVKYLVDTSALTRILRRQASPDWDVHRGRRWPIS
jgi:hypothetical protein